MKVSTDMWSPDESEYQIMIPDFQGFRDFPVKFHLVQHFGLWWHIRAIVGKKTNKYGAGGGGNIPEKYSEIVNVML